MEKIDYDVSSNLNFDALVTSLGRSHFVVIGVATEYCVRASALALRHRGLAVDDAVKRITAEGHHKALEDLAVAGVRLVTTASVVVGSRM